jgi:hypothetical protein
MHILSYTLIDETFLTLHAHREDFSLGAAALPHHVLSFVSPFHLLIPFFLDGFFDAGMLLSALKAKEEDDPNVDQRDVIRRNIGRRLKLSEY